MLIIKNSIGGNPEGLYVWIKRESADGAIIGYITDDDSSKYPDGELLDGYYYEQLKDGSEATF